MNQFLFLIGVLIVCVESQYDSGYTLDSPAHKIKGHPGKCFVNSVGLIDKGAEIIKIRGNCQSVLCLDGGKYRVKECPPFGMESTCHAAYPDKPFPECCTYEIKCENDDNQFFLLRKMVQVLPKSER